MKCLTPTMKTATEALKEERNKLRLTTGDGGLDALIDGIKQGEFYLFYSDEQRILDLVIHRILVSGVLPVERGGFDSKALYVNTCNYHRGKTLLNPSRLAMTAKCAGMDPKVVFQNIYAVSAFNELQQLMAVKEAAELVNKDEAVKLVAVHNLTRFVETSRTPSNARQILKQIVGVLKGVTSKTGAALVVTCTASRSGRGRIAKPLGGSYLRHEANIVVLLKSLTKDETASIKATLVKHPYKKTPHALFLSVPKGGVTLMGRITPSFRQQFQNLIADLKRRGGFQDSLISLEHKKAFDLLLTEAWSAESASMSNSGIPCITDVLNLLANVHNKKSVEELWRKLQELERVLEEPVEKNDEAAT